jgi:flagellar motor switch protein FliN/FliY
MSETQPPHSKLSMTITCVVGRVSLPLKDLMNLGVGSIVVLDDHMDDTIDIMMNKITVAKGHMVMIDDEKIGVVVSDVLS